MGLLQLAKAVRNKYEVVLPLQIRGFYNETSDLYKELKLFYPIKYEASTTLLPEYNIPVY